MLCEKCQMDIRGGEGQCPLCQNKLTGSPEPNIFPTIPTVYSQYKKFFKWLIFITSAAAIICLAINLMIPKSGKWSLYVLFGISTFWISLLTAIRKRRNLFKNITDQIVIISVIGLLWDLFTGWRGWSINYLIPIACSVAMLSLAILSRIKRAPIGDYLVYIIAVIIFAIAPLIFYLTGILKVAIPSIICIALSIITIIYLVVMEGKNMRQEISRRFHF